MLWIDTLFSGIAYGSVRSLTGFVICCFKIVCEPSRLVTRLNCSASIPLHRFKHTHSYSTNENYPFSESKAHYLLRIQSDLLTHLPLWLWLRSKMIQEQSQAAVCNCLIALAISAYLTLFNILLGTIYCKAVQFSSSIA